MFTSSEWLHDSSGYGSVPQIPTHAVHMYEAKYSPNVSPRICIPPLLSKVKLKPKWKQQHIYTEVINSNQTLIQYC